MQLVAALGALQGLLLAGVLFSRRSQRIANRLLGALMLTFTLYLVADVYYAAGLIREYPHFFGVSYPVPWLFGPLVYLYTVAASDSDWRLRPRDVLHFAPPVAVVVATLPIYMMSGAGKIALAERILAGEFPTVLTVLGPTMYVSGLSYSVATVAHLRRHKQRVEDSYSNTTRVNLNWLLRLAGAAAAIWLLAFTIRISDMLPASIQRPSEDLVGLAIAVLVYAIGYFGLRQPEIHRYAELVSRPTGPAAGSAPADIAPPPVDRSDARYQRSGLSDVEAATLKAELLALMAREQPYRDADLTLADLAERLDTTPHKLSEVLNSEVGQTFYDFVNGYRVEEVRRRLSEAKSKRLNVLSVAMDAGFASKSTFNQVFKKRTGQTPSTYRKALAG